MNKIKLYFIVRNRFLKLFLYKIKRLLFYDESDLSINADNETNDKDNNH